MLNDLLDFNIVFYIRWDISAMEQLPEYIRPFFKILLDEYAELEKQLAKEGREKSVFASKEAV